MKTWINVKYITELIPEVKFLQELYLSTKDSKTNVDMLKALELGKYKAFMYCCPRFYRFLIHDKRNEYIKTYDVRSIFNASNSYSLSQSYLRRVMQNNSFNGCDIFTDNVNRKRIALNDINIFSYGLYRKYKGNWYKLIDNCGFSNYKNPYQRIIRLAR